jgi:Protein of unknown function (DUF2752)
VAVSARRNGANVSTPPNQAVATPLYRAASPAWLGPAAVGLAALGACGVAAVINPYRVEGVPCPFHALTGLWCPLCGSTRALHSLFHGDVAAAFARNPLLLLVLPLLTLSWAAWLSDSVGGPRIWHLPYRRSVLVVSLVVIAAFWVLRNLPWSAASVLGP